MKTVIAKILANKKITPHHCMMRIESSYLAKAAKAGQFVEVRCGDGLDPLLRRPFGVHRIHKNGIEMLYEVVGKGTEILARRNQGDMLDVIGPLGNGFDVKSIVHSPQSIVLVAGGIGVAPMVALAEQIGSRVKGQGSSKSKKIFVLLGARTKSHVICENEFKKLGCAVSVTTDDGSKGRKGLVTEALKDLLRSTIYACGPTPMLTAVAFMAKEKSIPCQVSLEEHMACGVGVCLGCPVKVRKDLVDTEYKMVCKDGPVFAAEQIIW